MKGPDPKVPRSFALFQYLLLWGGGEANFQLKVSLDKMTKFLRGRHRGVESTLLLKHLPGEALGKSNQGSFQTEGLRACGPSPREGPAEAAGQQGFQRVPTGWTPGPSGCRESGEQSGAAFSPGGARRQEASREFSRWQGPLCPLSADTCQAPPCVWCHPREGRPALGESQPGLHATPSFAQFLRGTSVTTARLSPERAH